METEDTHDSDDDMTTMTLKFVSCLLRVPTARKQYSLGQKGKRIVGASTLRQKFQIKLAISPSHSILIALAPAGAQAFYKSSHPVTVN